MVCAAECRTPQARGGTYEDPFPSGIIGARPLVAFPTTTQQFEFVDLVGSRDVAVIFPLAWGQINHVPGTWKPEWEPATLVAYKRGGLFSIVFEQPDAEFRTLKDFYPLPGNLHASLAACG